MDSNRCSREHSDQPPDNPPDDLDVLEAAVDGLARDLTGLPEPVRAQRVLRLRRLVDRQEGHWLNELAAVDACGGRPAPTRASRRPRPPAGCATGCSWGPARRPQTGGVRPQLLVTVDLDSLLGHQPALGVRLAGRGRWPRRRVGGWPATAR